MKQAIASLGGSLLDCNRVFCHLSNCTKQELCSSTVFKLIAREDLQRSFEHISSRMTASHDGIRDENNPFLVRGIFPLGDDFGLRITFISNEEGAKQLLCITMIKNPPSLSGVPLELPAPRPLELEWQLDQQAEDDSQASALMSDEPPELATPRSFELERQLDQQPSKKEDNQASIVVSHDHHAPKGIPENGLQLPFQTIG